MRKSCSISVMAVLASFLVLECLASFTSRAHAAAEEIPVGVCTGVTGPFAGFGVGGVFGVQAAVEDINKKGGVSVKDLKKKLPIKLIVVNNESDETKAGSLAQNLILRDKVKFIVNGMDPPHVRAPIAAACEQNKVIHITGCGPYEAWMGLRKSAPKPWQYTWTASFAIATPAKAGDFRAGKLGYTMMDSWLGALDELAANTTRGWPPWPLTNPTAGDGIWLSAQSSVRRDGMFIG